MSKKTVDKNIEIEYCQLPETEEGIERLNKAFDLLFESILKGENKDNEHKNEKSKRKIE
jgi:hypothetical protein